MCVCVSLFLIVSECEFEWMCASTVAYEIATLEDLKGDVNMTCSHHIMHLLFTALYYGWEDVGEAVINPSKVLVLRSLKSKAPVYHKFGCPLLVHLNECECFFVSLTGHKAGQPGLVKRKCVGPLPNKLWYSSVDMWLSYKPKTEKNKRKR